MKNLILKELQNTIYNYRFLLCFFLCIILIPLSMFVSFNNYNKDLSTYNKEIKSYNNEQHRGGANFNAQGYRMPSPYSFISKGVDAIIPHVVITSRDGFELKKKQQSDSYFYSMFGNIDLLYIVIMIVSLMIIVLAYDSISGEIESGTIKLILSNSVSKWKLIIAKMLSILLIITICFVISLIVGLIILNSTNWLLIFSQELFSRLLIFLLFSVLFILIIINICLFVSALSGRSSTSITLILLIWCFITLLIPKISPIIAKIVYPIQTEAQINNQIKLVKQDMTSELKKQEDALTKKLFKRNNLDPELLDAFIKEAEYKEMKDKLDIKLNALRDEYKKKINETVNKIRIAYEHKVKVQNSIAVNISRVSPSSLYCLIISEISNTGFSEIENFTKNAMSFQEEVKQNIYDKYNYNRYSIRGKTIQGYSLKGSNTNLTIPEFRYSTASLKETIKWSLPNFLILFLYAVLFFLLSFISFIRKDVRKTY